MNKALTTLPIRYCEYRFCLGPQEIPEERRSDALYCCNEHGTMERNARQKDNKFLVSDLRYIKSNYRVINDLYIRGKRVVTKEILEALGFNFRIIIELNDFDSQSNTQSFRIFEYTIEVDTINNQYSIKKNK